MVALPQTGNNSSNPCNRIDSEERYYCSFTLQGRQTQGRNPTACRVCSVCVFLETTYANEINAFVHHSSSWYVIIWPDRPAACCTTRKTPSTRSVSLEQALLRRGTKLYIYAHLKGAPTCATSQRMKVFELLASSKPGAPSTEACTHRTARSMSKKRRQRGRRAPRLR